MNYTLGRVGIVVHDSYEPTKTYEELDLVPYEGGAYIAKDTTTGNPPTDKTYWVEILVPGVTKAYVDNEDLRLQGEIDDIKQNNWNRAVNQILEDANLPIDPPAGYRVAYSAIQDGVNVPTIALYRGSGQWEERSLFEADTFRNLEEVGYPVYRVVGADFVKETLNADDFASVIYSSTTPAVQNGKIWLKPV